MATMATTMRLNRILETENAGEKNSHEFINPLFSTASSCTTCARQQTQEGCLESWNDMRLSIRFREIPRRERRGRDLESMISTFKGVSTRDDMVFLQDSGHDDGFCPHKFVSCMLLQLGFEKFSTHRAESAIPVHYKTRPRILPKGTHPKIIHNLRLCDAPVVGGLSSLTVSSQWVRGNRTVAGG